MTPIADIADAVEAALRAEARRLDGEQAVRGLDALPEVALHPVIAAGLMAAGFGVAREVRYPAARARRRNSEGDRCDLVLHPPGRELASPGREPTLFDRPDPVRLEEAFWLEVKVVTQFTEEGPNAGYASGLMAAFREDAWKLARDPQVLQAGLLVVLFAADRRVAEHDLDLALARSLDAGVPLGIPARRLVPIADRIGHRVCTVALHPVASA